MYFDEGNRCYNEYSGNCMNDEEISGIFSDCPELAYADYRWRCCSTCSCCIDLRGFVGPRSPAVLRGPIGRTGPAGAVGSIGLASPTRATDPAAIAPAANALTVTNEAAQTPAANSALFFDHTQASIGTDIFYSQDTGIFTLAKEGLYEIHYNTVGTNAAASSPPVTIGVHLANGGAAIPGTRTEASINAVDDIATLAGTTIVDVTTAPTNITLTADNESGSYSFTSVTIRKIN